MPEWLGGVLALTGAGFAGTTVVGGLLWNGARRRAEVLASQRDASEAERERVERQVDSLTSQHRELVHAVEAAEERRGEVVKRYEEAVRALDRARQRVSRLEGEARAQDEARLAAESNGASWKRRFAELNHEMARLKVEERNVRQLLAAVGIEVPQEHHEPLAHDRRARTRDAVQQLLVDCGAVSTALVHDEGFVAVGAGQEAGIDRLGAVAGWFAEAAPEFAEVLCAPVASWSVMDRRFCSHLLRVPGTPWSLGVENMGEAPLFAMRHAHLRMVELPAPARAVPESPQVVLDLDEAPDVVLGRKLSEWARRWGCDAATVLDVEGRPLGATASAQPAPVMALRRRLTPAYVRMLRDGRFLEDVTLVARTADDTAVTLRMAGSDLEAPLIAAVGPAPVPDNALDELAGTLRWHLDDASDESRQAS